MTPEEREDLRRHLRARYAGVLDQAQLERHIDTYVGLELAHQQVDHLAAKVEPGGRLLDVGSGFGSFVLAARTRGYDAVGIEIEPFEVAFARRRLVRERPCDDPARVYHAGDGRALPFQAESFDVVTLWNVLEHVDDANALLREAARALRPHGVLFLVCPNYASIRREAHYLVLWPSLLPRKLAAGYLRWRGRDPRFFETSIHYRTNGEVLSILKRLGLKPRDPRDDKLERPESIQRPLVRNVVLAARRAGLGGILRLALATSFYNPLRHSIVLYAWKESLD